VSGRLDGKVALITGGARSIGAAAARAFVAEGAHVIVADVLTAEGEILVKELGDRAHFAQLDVTDESAWAGCIDDITGAHERLDILVNNAGVASLAPIVHTTTAEYLRVIGVNQVGVFLGMRTAIPAMSHSGTGSIVNVSSIEGIG
jgi:3alpha(or 20beta)-hydroxysteroid dehydrogenase